MILAIDVGNTNIVIGCCEGERILFTERLSVNRTATVLEYVISFKTVLELYNIEPHDVEGGIISSVVPSITTAIKSAVMKLVGKSIKVVGPGIKTGLNIKIDDPKELGADLVIGAVAAIQEYKAPMVIFDLGTATTASVIDENMCYLGGMIMPGAVVSLNSLTNSTSQLPRISLEAPKKLIGGNTVECMTSGIIYSTAASIDGICERIEEHFGKEVTVIATGGIAPTIVPFCKKKIVLDDELLLKGLIILYNKNK